MCKALDLAEYIIGLIPVDNLKLQKLLYYCQGIHLARKDTTIFDDEIEALQYGPVVINVYNEYKSHGLDIICLDNINDKNTCISKEDERETIDMVLEHYGDLSGLELVAKTHSETPWKTAYNNNSDNIITIDSMKDYFKKTIEFDNE